jgi:Molecular chaperone (small heat shock protein)
MKRARKNGHYIRRERFSGTYSRSFYVGEDVNEEDIKAKFGNGTLKLYVPDKEKQPKVETKKVIAIED